MAEPFKLQKGSVNEIDGIIVSAEPTVTTTERHDDYHQSKEDDDSSQRMSPAASEDDETSKTVICVRQQQQQHADEEKKQDFSLLSPRQTMDAEQEHDRNAPKDDHAADPNTMDNPALSTQFDSSVETDKTAIKNLNEIKVDVMEKADKASSVVAPVLPLAAGQEIAPPLHEKSVRQYVELMEQNSQNWIDLWNPYQSLQAMLDQSQENSAWWEPRRVVLQGLQKCRAICWETSSESNCNTLATDEPFFQHVLLSPVVWDENTKNVPIYSCRCKKLQPKRASREKRQPKQETPTAPKKAEYASKRCRQPQSTGKRQKRRRTVNEDASDFEMTDVFDDEEIHVSPRTRSRPQRATSSKESLLPMKKNSNPVTKEKKTSAEKSTSHGQKWTSSNPIVQEFIDVRIRIDEMEKTNPDKKEQMKAYEQVLEKYGKQRDVVKAAKATGWVERRRRTLKNMRKCINNCFQGDEDAFCTQVTDFLGVGESYKCLCQGYSRRPLTKHQIRLQASGRTPLPPEAVKTISDDGVIMVGTHYDRNLVVIPPPGDQEEKVKLIRGVSRHFGDKKTRNEMRAQCRIGKDPSVRDIQSKRYEVFVHAASDKGSQFWDKHLKAANLPANAADQLIEYAIQQTKRDPRIRDGGEYKYGNFSLIVSYGECDPQSPHVDLLLPNYQFLLVLTDESPSTYFYDLDDEDEIQTIDDLRRLWNKNKKSVGGKFPANLEQVMNASVDVKSFLRDFGKVLHSTDKFRKKERYLPNVAAGTLLSLPGSVVHAGPSTIDFRMVLFFSAVPVRVQDIEYNPDNQLSNILLCGLFVQVCWRARGITKEDRLYLLRMLAHYIGDAACRKGWDRHFHDDSKFRSVVLKMIEETSFSELDKFLQKAAGREDLCRPHVQTLDLHGEFRLVSDVRLHIKDEMQRINVYCRAGDNKALLHFPALDGGSHEYWEGDGPKDHYTLSMNDGSVVDYEAERGITVFDGTNGVLRDNDGDVVEFVLVEAEEQAAQP